MNATVFIESTAAAESLGAITIRALVRTFTSMSAVVDLKVAWSVKHFEACSTLVLLLTKITLLRVLANVLFQIVPTSKTFVALGASKFGS